MIDDWFGALDRVYEVSDMADVNSAPTAWTPDMRLYGKDGFSYVKSKGDTTQHSSTMSREDERRHSERDGRGAPGAGAPSRPAGTKAGGMVWAHAPPTPASAPGSRRASFGSDGKKVVGNHNLMPQKEFGAEELFAIAELGRLHSQYKAEKMAAKRERAGVRSSSVGRGRNSPRTMHGTMGPPPARRT